MNWINNGHNIWNIFVDVDVDISVFFANNSPKIFGNVKAKAIVMKSLAQNKPYDIFGNFLTSVTPKNWVSDLSL